MFVPCSRGLYPGGPIWIYPGEYIVELFESIESHTRNTVYFSSGKKKTRP